MNEVQGPTPAGTSRPYRSLAEALRAHRIPEQNHDFIVAVAAAVGTTAYIDRGRYIEALRRDGAALHIGRTYTNGFTEDEQVLVGGRALPLLPSEGRAPYFYVSHPSAVLGASGGGRTSSVRGTANRPAKPKGEPRTVKSKPIERDYGVCDVCFMVKTAAGHCGCD